jgi:hypothetical protein
LRPLKEIPLFGPLFNASRSSVRDSFLETAIGVIFSTLPLWFFPIIFSKIAIGSPSIFEQISNSVGRGDFYIYATALIGPLIYVITKNYVQVDKSDKFQINNRSIGKWTFEFPFGIFFFFSAVFTCMIASVCYGYVNISIIDRDKFSINSDFVFATSVLLYVFCVFCIFSVGVFRNELLDVAKSMGDDERNFLQEWDNRR